MSFKREHPNYKSYKEPSGYHYHDVPYSAWTELESLIAEAGGAEEEYLARIVSIIATKARAGNVENSFAYGNIQYVVSKLRQKVKDGKFDLFMDTLAMLCEEGDLTTDALNEFLADNKIGYIAIRMMQPQGIAWEKIGNNIHNEEKGIAVSEDEGVLWPDDADAVMPKEGVKESEKRMTEKKQRTERDCIFISHRTVDAPVAEMLLDYMVGCGIPKDRIFCSSLPGNNVNMKISPEVRQKLKKAAIIVLILSKDYYESAYCLNEAGVAWYLDDEVISIPIGLPEIKHFDMIGFLDAGYILRRLDNDDDVAYIIDKTQDALKLNPVKHGIITQERQKLVRRYRKYIEDRDATPEKGGTHNKYTGEEEHSFGDKDEKFETLQSDNPIVQAIINAGGTVRGIASLTATLGLSAARVRNQLQRAISDGEIEAVGAAGNRIYRLTQKASAEEDDNSYTPIIGKNDVGNISVEVAFLLVYAADGNGQIMRVQTLGAPVEVSAGGKQFMADLSHRESARWVEALDTLICWRWVKPVGNKGHVYELTGMGYQRAEWLKENMQINTENEPLEELKEF